MKQRAGQRCDYPEKNRRYIDTMKGYDEKGRLEAHMYALVLGVVMIPVLAPCRGQLGTMICFYCRLAVPLLLFATFSSCLGCLKRTLPDWGDAGAPSPNR